MNIDADLENYVDYKYKIVTNSDADLTDILSVLERKLLEWILRDIFECSTGDRALSDVTDHDSRRLAILGASANPPDKISGK